MKNLHVMYTEQYEVIITYLSPMSDEMKTIKRIVDVPYCYNKDKEEYGKNLHDHAFAIVARDLFWTEQSPIEIKYESVEVNYL